MWLPILEWIKSKIFNKYRQEYRATWTLMNWYVGAMWVHFQKPFGSFVYCLFYQKHNFYCFLYVYANELIMSLYTKIWMWIFITVLFIISKTGKQSRVASIGESIKKLVCSYNVIVSTLKEMSHQNTKLHWRMVSGFYCVWSVTMMRMHNVWFQLQDIQEKAEHNK